MGRTLAMGDIHGNYKALVQCLERSSFNKQEDTLIQLGDIVDGYPDIFECIEELLSIPKLISIKGNHDQWFNEFLTYGMHPCRWLQGGISTARSYIKHAERQNIVDMPKMGGHIVGLTNADIPLSHIKFFAAQKLYYIDHKNRFFVHGGFDRLNFVDYLDHSNPSDFYWNRELWEKAKCCTGDQRLNTANEFTEIYIGHTATPYDFKHFEPITIGGVTNLDQGAGWGGKLTIMDINTKEYWQSDLAKELYEKNER